MISFEKVSKFLLSDISFCIPESTIVGVIGRSGSGKTTLLKLACGLLACEKGRVRTFLQDPVKRRRKIVSGISFFSAEHMPFRDDDTIADEFRKLRAAYRLEKEEFQKEYKQLAEGLGFLEYEDVEIRQLSLGQRRRAELAAALIVPARLILLDEPTVGIDESGRQIFLEKLQRKKENGVSVLSVSENMMEIEKYCDRILLLDSGQLLYYGDRERLMRRYAPVNEMEIVYSGRLPDLEDLPLLEYRINHNTMKFWYNENILSAVEIVGHVASQTVVEGMHVARPRLEDVILRGDFANNSIESVS